MSVRLLLEDEAEHGVPGEHPELLMALHKMLRLAGLPISVIFVQDGPDRPAVKRGVHVQTTPHFLLHGMKDFAQALGFKWKKVCILPCLLLLNVLKIIPGSRRS